MSCTNSMTKSTCDKELINASCDVDVNSTTESTGDAEMINASRDADVVATRNIVRSVRRRIFVVALLVFASTAAFLAFTRSGQQLLDQAMELTGWKDRDMFEVAVAMHQDLVQWKARQPEEGPQKDPGSLNNPTQSKAIVAYFDFLVKSSLPDPAENAVSVDTAYVEWMRASLPEASRLELPDMTQQNNGGKGRQEVLNALTDLRKTLGILEKDPETVDGIDQNHPGYFTKRALRDLEAIRNHLNFRRWYTSDDRMIYFDGSPRPDPDTAREWALRFRVPDHEGLEWSQVRKLHGALVRWTGNGAPVADDRSDRPWLVAGSFFEYLSLRRLGFTEANYHRDVIRLFPLDPVVSKHSLSKEAIRNKVVLQGIRDLVDNLPSEEKTDGRNFDDLFPALEKHYTDSPALWREARRLQDDAEAETDAMKKLAALINQIRQSAQLSNDQ